MMHCKVLGEGNQRMSGQMLRKFLTVPLGNSSAQIRHYNIIQENGDACLPKSKQNPHILLDIYVLFHSSG